MSFREDEDEEDVFGKEMRALSAIEQRDLQEECAKLRTQLVIADVALLKIKQTSIDVNASFIASKAITDKTAIERVFEFVRDDLHLRTLLPRRNRDG